MAPELKTIMLIPKIFYSPCSYSLFQDQDGNKCYIASQGPVANTVYDFWRMILQYKVKVIAMACRLVEMGRVSCIFS